MSYFYSSPHADRPVIRLGGGNKVQPDGPKSLAVTPVSALYKYDCVWLLAAGCGQFGSEAKGFGPGSVQNAQARSKQGWRIDDLRVTPGGIRPGRVAGRAPALLRSKTKCVAEQV